MGSNPIRGSTLGLEGFDVGESRTRSTSGPGFDSQQIHGRLCRKYPVPACLTVKGPALC